MNVYPISREVFARTVDRPDYLRYGLVCMVLMHRSNRLRDVDPEVNALQHTFLHFRGVVIRSLLEAIATEETQKSNIVLAGTLNLLLLEVSSFYGSRPGYQWLPLTRVANIEANEGIYY